MGMRTPQTGGLGCLPNPWPSRCSQALPVCCVWMDIGWAMGAASSLVSWGMAGTVLWAAPLLRVFDLATGPHGDDAC